MTYLHPGTPDIAPRAALVKSETNIETNKPFFLPVIPMISMACPTMPEPNNVRHIPLIFSKSHEPLGKKIPPMSHGETQLHPNNQVINVIDTRIPGTGTINDEPVSQIADNDKFYSIVADLHDVEEGKIRISLENTILTLAWHDREAGHHEKEICLPCRMRLINKKFQDGVLEISLQKIDH